MAKISELADKLVIYSSSLDGFHDTSTEVLANDVRLRWAFRYGTLACIQLAMDIACAVIARRNLGMPHSYIECIRLLKINAFIDNEISDFLFKCVPVRENLLHDNNLDIEKDAYEIMHKCHLFIKYSESVTSFEK